MIIHQNEILIPRFNHTMSNIFTLESMVCEYGLLIPTQFFSDEILLFLKYGKLPIKRHFPKRTGTSIGFILDKDLVLWEFVTTNPGYFRYHPLILNKHKSISNFNNEILDDVVLLGMSLGHSIKQIINGLDETSSRFNANDYYIYSLDYLKDFLSTLTTIPLIKE